MTDLAYTVVPLEANPDLDLPERRIIVGHDQISDDLLEIAVEIAREAADELYVMGLADVHLSIAPTAPGGLFAGVARLTLVPDTD